MARAALVTGAARRIGRRLALECAAAGYDVAVHCHASEHDAAEVAAEIEGRGRKAAVLRADLAVEAETTALVGRAIDAVGPLALLVNNASAFEDDRVGGLDRASWDTHIETNLRAPIVLAEAFAGQLPADGEGLIVNILDQRVLSPTPEFFSYGVSKGALWTATRMLALALAPRIRVNAVGPGPTLPSYVQSPQDFEAEAASTPLRRGATPDDIAAALRYLIEARAVTGQLIAVDAGQHLPHRTAP